MKVLFLTNVPSPYRVGFFTELGKKCELTVLYERRTASDRDKNWKADAGKTYQAIFLKGVEVGTDNSFCPQVFHYLKSEYDIVVIGMYSTYTAMLAMMWMKLNHKQYVISTDGGFVRKESRIKKKFKSFWMSGASFWLGTGKLAREYLCYYGAKNERIFDYPFTSVDEADIIPTVLKSEEKKELKKELGIFAEKVVISVGQFIPRKGFDILLESCKSALDDNTELLIIGGTKEDLERVTARKIPQNVKVCPFMSKHRLFQHYLAADFFVLPTREDVWGLVVNEAMACGLPVLTTDRCGAGIEMIKHGENGWIIPAEDRKALADWVYKIVNSSELRAIGSKAIEKAYEYTYQTMANQHYNIFKNIIDK